MITCNEHMTHLVNRLTFDLLCGSEEQALGLRREVSSVVLQEQVQEMIDRVCSRYADEEVWVNIGQLEVDLGVLSAGSFSASFATALLDRFERELVARLSQVVAGPVPSSRRHSEMELLQWLLQYGVLPWWATATEPDPDTLCREALRHNPEGFARFLWQQGGNPSVWQRISYQLNAENRRQIIGLLPALSRAADYLQEWIHEIYTTSFPGQRPDADARQSIVQKIILEQAPRLLQNREALPVQEMVNGKADSLPAETELGWLKSLLLEGDTPAPVAHLGQMDMTDTLFNGNEASGDAPEKFLIKTAGIVLLAPFFKSFFTELGLLDGDKWINKAAAYRAVHLLKFLGTGMQRQPEYSLVLEKICCSLWPTEPVPVDILLEEKEVQEAEQLLAAVITHWRALKNTSVNGLRGSFLTRDGILSRRENGWLLQVERKTLDVLLDNLPWGYGSVRLPWNDDIIMVEW